MATALVNHNVIAWARERAQIPPEVLSAKLNKKYPEWESGESTPTFKQATDLAKKLNIPLGYLFLSDVPEEHKLTADLRTRRPLGADRYSTELQDVIADTTRKQDWYRDYLTENGSDPLPFVGRFNPLSPSHDIADDITSVLDLNLENRRDLTRDSIITYIASQAEKAGICVLRNGKVGFNTHRKLNSDEFGGFALPDTMAPFVFVNTADFPAAQLFTLVHELTHIWLNVEGVSDAGLSHISGRSEIEDLCDQVAVEVLVPEEIFRRHWGEHGQSLDQKAMYLQKIFKVSSVVIARRALGLNLITTDEFFSYYTYLKRIWDESKKRNKERNPDGGADFNNTFPAANSHNLTEAVLSSVGSGETLYREGSRLLGVKPATLAIQAKQRGYA